MWVKALLPIACLLMGFATLVPQDPPKNGKVEDKDSRGRVTREVWYVNDTVHGPLIGYNAYGDTIYMSHYEKGKLHGWARRWHKNGQLASKGRFYKGLEVGEHRMWFDDGNPQELKSYLDLSTLKSGEVLPVGSIRHGEWATWYYDNQRLSQYFYQKGNRVGTWKEWYYTGERKSERSYSKGEQVGTWKVWDTKGTEYDKFNCSQHNWGSSFICEKHGDAAYTDDIGICQHCGKGTSSGQYMYCQSSACQLKKCQACGGDL